MKRLPWWRRPYSSKRVLEIGPGHNPFAGATHLLERYVADGHERGGNALLVHTSARLIVGEATVLPFAKGSFDFVYASHVLEHVEEPEQACREIMRVGMAGHIETPSPWEMSLLRIIGFIDGSCFRRAPMYWRLSPSWLRRWRGFAPVVMASFCASFMRRWISGRLSIVSVGRRRPPSSIGSRRFRPRCVIRWWTADRMGDHADSPA